MGPSLATEIILNSKLGNKFDLIHLDTSDHRDLKTLGVFDFKNIYIAFKNYLFLFWYIIRYWPALIYVPISQTTVGYFRDAIFIFISKLFGRRVICHLRGGNFKNWYDSSGLMIQRFVRIVHSIVDGQIVLGEKLKFLFDGIISKEKLSVVPNGRDFEFDFDRKEQLNNVRILFLSNFMREKGILDVLYAIPYVYSYNQDIEFIFAGNWRDEATKQEFESFIDENPNMKVTMYGPILGQSKFDLLFSSGIFVFPTYYPPEGHPWVIVEAMAAGLPIVSTDQGAITESVKDKINGFIIDKKDPKQLAEKIIFLIENPELRNKMGKESRRLYLENFTEAKMIERFTNAFNTVLRS